MMLKDVVEGIAFVRSKSLLESMYCVRILLKGIWIILLVLFEHYVCHFNEGVELAGDLKRVLPVENLVLILLLL